MEVHQVSRTSRCSSSAASRRLRPCRSWTWLLSLPALLAVAALGPLAARAAQQRAWSWLGGPETARVSAISGDPTDPRVVYAGTYDSGLYKTVDGAQSWFPLNRGVPGGGEITDIVVNPGDPREVFIRKWGAGYFNVYMSLDGGTNWVAQPQALLPAVFDGRDHTQFALSANDVFRSVDEGFIWHLAGTIPDLPIYALAGDTADSKVLYASSPHALYKSTDGGASFMRQEIPIDFTQDAPTTILTDAAAPGTVYVASFAGIWKSVDSGTSWSLAIHGLRGLRNRNRIVKGLFAVPSSPGALYALLGPRLSSRSELYRSDDGAATWVDQGFFGTDSRAFFALAVSSAEILHASDLFGTPGVFRSADGGKSWAAAVGGMAGPIHGVAFQPGALGGLYAVGTFSTWKSPDGGATWHDLKQQLDFLQVDPFHPGVLEAIQAGGFTTSRDGGHTWSAVQDPPTCELLTKIVVTPRPRPTLYALTTTTDQHPCVNNNAPGLSSTDGGKTWREIPEISFGADLALDPADLTTLWAIVGARILKSSDGGHSWTDESPSTFEGYPLHLAFSPVSGELYLAVSSGVILTRRGRAAGWQPVGPLPLPPSTPVTPVPDPHVAHRVYALAPKAVLRSDDGGKTWFSPGRGLTRTTSVQALAVVPDGTLVAATDNGLFALAPGPD